MCPLCNDIKSITLPFGTSTRVYACPECVTIPDHKLYIAKSTIQAETFFLENHPEAKQAYYIDAVQRVTSELFNAELVEFTEKRDQRGVMGTTTITAEIAVLTPDRIKRSRKE